MSKRSVCCYSFERKKGILVKTRSVQNHTDISASTLFGTFLNYSMKNTSVQTHPHISTSTLIFWQENNTTCLTVFEITHQQLRIYVMFYVFKCSIKIYVMFGASLYVMFYVFKCSMKIYVPSSSCIIAWGVHVLLASK